jgi:tetratricopeptide (TPR) repeat protein
LVAGRPVGPGLPPDRSYAEGRFHLERFTSASLPKAKECFEQAVLATRNSAPIYAAISEYYVSAALLGIKTSAEAMPKADWAARKALSIDADTESAHACLGIVAGLYEHNWEESAGSFRRAFEINPGSGSVRQAYALWHLIPLGHIAEAAVEMQRALQAEPLSPRRLASLAYVCYLNGEYDESTRLCFTALDIDARFWLAHWVLGWALLASWRNEAALEHARAALAEDPSSGWTKAVNAVVCSVAGVQAEADALHGAWDAVVRMGTGDAEEAFRCAARAVQRREALIPFVIRHALFDPYRPDPRYAAITSRMRIPATGGAA